MDKLMDSPWFLRFTALFLAIVLFISVQAEERDSKNRAAGDQRDVIRDVPVEVYYDDENLVVTGVPETVNVTIEGPINIVQTTKSLKDFTLFIDLRTMTMGKHEVEIEHENISDKLQVVLDPATIEINIEERITSTFRVDPEFNERLLAEGYHVVGVEVDPATISVTGAKSVVESISFVKATAADEAGIRASFEQEARVRVLDRDLNKLNVSIQPEHVNVRVEIAENSKEVPIVLKQTGNPPEHITIESVEAVEKVVRLSGPSQVLHDLEEIVAEVDLSKVKGQEVIEVTLKKPSGVTSMSVTKIKLNVKATTTESVEEEAEAEASLDIPPEEVKEIVEVETETVNFEDIPVAVVGLDEKYQCTVMQPDDGTVTLTVTAGQDIIQTLEQSDFTVMVDASKASTEGEQVFPVTVKGPTDVKWTLSDHEVTLNIVLA